MATLTPLTVGNAATPNGWTSAPNGNLGDNSDSTYGYDSTNADGAYDQGWALGDVDADFQSMDTLNFVLRYARSANNANKDWLSLQVRIVNGATILAASDSGGTFQTAASSITTTTPTNTSSTGFSYVNTSASKATWDAATVEIRINTDKIKGGNSDEFRVYEADFTGTYTQGAAGQNITGSAAFAPGLSFPTGSVDLVVTGSAAFAPTLIFGAGASSPSVLAVSSNVQITADGSVNVPLPAGSTSGDILIVQVVGVGHDITAYPSGSTVIGTAGLDTADTSATVFYFEYQGDTPAFTIDIPATPNANVQTARVTAGAVLDKSDQSTDVNTTTHTSNALTPSFNNSLFVGLHAGIANVNTVAWSAPFTEEWDSEYWGMNSAASYEQSTAASQSFTAESSGTDPTYDGINTITVWYVTGGQINLSVVGATFTPTLSFPTGTVAGAGAQTVTGSAAFTPALSFPAGSVDFTVTGSAAFAPGLSFPAGSVDFTVTGTTFTPTLVFPQGSVDVTVAGTAFTPGLVFPTGLVNAVQTVTGTVFAPTLVFPTGLANVEQTVTGTVFAPTLVFPQGSVDFTVTGSAAFAPGLTFPQGQLNLTVAGSTFTPGLTFPQGTVGTGVAPQTVTGSAAFAPGLSFPTGSVDFTVTGSVFAPSLTFPQGQVNLTVAGSVFAPGLTFPTGSASIAGGSQTVTGSAAFTPGLTFGAGSVDLTVTGTVFAPTLSFPQGSVDFTVTGSVFTPTLVFPSGSVDLTVTGTVFTPTLVFPAGSLDLTVLGALFAPTLTFPTGSVTGEATRRQSGATATGRLTGTAAAGRQSTGTTAGRQTADTSTGRKSDLLAAGRKSGETN